MAHGWLFDPQEDEGKDDSIDDRDDYDPGSMDDEDFPDASTEAAHWAEWFSPEFNG